MSSHDVMSDTALTFLQEGQPVKTDRADAAADYSSRYVCRYYSQEKKSAVTRKKLKGEKGA